MRLNSGSNNCLLHLIVTLSSYPNLDILVSKFTARSSSRSKAHGDCPMMDSRVSEVLAEITFPLSAVPLLYSSLESQAIIYEKITNYLSLLYSMNVSVMQCVDQVQSLLTAPLLNQDSNAKNFKPSQSTEEEDVHMILVHIVQVIAWLEEIKCGALMIRSFNEQETFMRQFYTLNSCACENVDFNFSGL